MERNTPMAISAEFKASYRKGVLTGLPLIVAYIPFALVFGVFAADLGLSVVEALSMSAVVVAGAAQFAALGLLADDAPAIVAIFTGLCVNLRMFMYSAHIAEHWQGATFWRRAAAAYVLHDQSYGMSIGRYMEGKEPTLSGKFGWYFGVTTPTTGIWLIGTTLGAALGKAIPESWSLDVAAPIAFLAIVSPMIRRPPHVVAAVVAAGASLALTGLPFGFGVLAAGLLGMLAGAATDCWLARGAAEGAP